MSQSIERVHYYNGEFLDAGDFQADQDYHSQKLAWLNQSMFTYGVATGLHVTDMAEQRLLTISPGMAIDSSGNEIILTCEASLSHNCAAGLYYLTISFAQEYGDPVRENDEEPFSRINYKRVVEQPKIQLTSDRGDPGIYILLAVITVSNNGALAAIDYNNGQSMRRQCGVNAGTVQFYLEGIGESSPSMSGFQNQTTGANGIMVQSPLTIFTGPVTSRKSLGIGAPADTGSLTVRGLVLIGAGAISSENTTVTCVNGNFTPTPRVGDTLIAQTEIGPAGEGRRVVQIFDSQTLEVDLPFDQPLDNVGYSIARDGIAAFRTATDQSVMELDSQGNVGIGLTTLTEDGDVKTGEDLVNIQNTGMVGIGLSSDPEETLQVGGNVKADAFIGDGSGLTGLAGQWSASPTESDDIYYNTGGVAVGSQTAGGALSVSAYSGFFGTGVITNAGNTITGDGTAFTGQLQVGDQIQVTDENGTVQTVTVASVSSDTEATTSSAIDPAVSGVGYTILRPIAAFYEEDGGDPVLWVGRDGKVGINQPLPQAALHVEGDLIVTGSIGGSITLDQLTVDSLTIEKDLTLAAGASLNAESLALDGDLSVSGALTVGDNSVVLKQVGTAAILEGSQSNVLAVTEGAQGRLTLNQYADVILENPEREVSGRALAVLDTQELCLNYGNDFSNGIRLVGQIKAEDLTTPPEGTAVVSLVIDPTTGKIYLAQQSETTPSLTSTSQSAEVAEEEQGKSRGLFSFLRRNK